MDRPKRPSARTYSAGSHLSTWRLEERIKYLEEMVEWLVHQYDTPTIVVDGDTPSPYDPAALVKEARKRRGRKTPSMR